MKRNQKFFPVFFVLVCMFFVTGCNENNSSDFELNRIIQFGMWPQTLCDVTESELSLTGRTYDGNKEFSDKNGNRFVKVDSASVYGTGYTFSDGSPCERKKTYWFRVEPISWRVIAIKGRNGKMILSEKILTAAIPYCNTRNVRSIDAATVWPNNYKYSNIRSYLNEDFYQKAFSEEEQLKINEVLVKNGEDTTSSRINKFACDDTRDSIFLLSYQDLCNADFGFKSDADRVKHPSDYALANNAYRSAKEGQGGWWWLRSPYGGVSYYAKTVWSGGNLDYKDYIDNPSMGLVPALVMGK